MKKQQDDFFELGDEEKLDDANANPAEPDKEVPKDPQSKDDTPQPSDTSTDDTPSDESPAGDEDDDNSENNDSQDNNDNDGQDDGLRPPKQAPNEPDWKFELREKIWEGQRQKAAAKTPEEREEAQKVIDNAREGFKNPPRDNSNQRDTSLDERTDNPPETSKNPQGDDLEKMVERKLAEREAIETQRNALTEFFEKHPEYKDKTNQDTFFDLVESNFNYHGKDKKTLEAYFETAHNWMFGGSVAKKIDKSSEVKNKVNSVNFKGQNAPQKAKAGNDETQQLRDNMAAKGQDIDWLLDDDELE